LFGEVRFPENTLTESSRLYSATIERFEVFNTDEDMLPSFSNCTVQ
jgi:hypothetical protein